MLAGILILILTSGRKEVEEETCVGESRNKRSHSMTKEQSRHS